MSEIKRLLGIPIGTHFLVNEQTLGEFSADQAQRIREALTRESATLQSRIDASLDEMTRNLQLVLFEALTSTGMPQEEASEEALRQVLELLSDHLGITMARQVAALGLDPTEELGNITLTLLEVYEDLRPDSAPALAKEIFGEEDALEVSKRTTVKTRLPN